MEKKICVVCNTENEKHFTYCRFCGAHLPVVDRKPVVEEVSAPENQGTEEFKSQSGISTEEYCAYIGKGANRILSAFKRMEETSSRFFWCFPIMVLGLAFGFYGISAWFFYRRMIKYGWLSTLCGFLVTALNFLLNFSLNTSVIEALATYGADVYSILAYYDPVSVSSILSTVATFFTCVFGLHMYKTKVENDILNAKSSFEGEELLYLLSARGGCRFSYIFIPLFFWLNTTLLALAANML